ncbi:unnamed protein product (macronuclear) [Paramecium tetraurelia]|uniref:Cache domain-containing protein n=1 Tax=Paramecium tetraurelia TaxID=5888 RepID=A0CLZ1_PARTE|nr:uncharacterized protein GSPATT00008287001 [Paramecium tetraurelia]CAK71808.1 unnamed protein product [Paramecium tetraurelia]|eukprot:XP_001439205.1 hypothetical protein (macronuclear) [Paramecium tetraurelia strain d4-2]
MKMKSQIIILDVIILFMVIVVCSIGIYVEAKLFYEISLESSYIMMNSTDIKQVDRIGSQIESYLITKHKRSNQLINEGIQLLDNIANFLFHFANRQDQQIYNGILDLCLTEEEQKIAIYIKNTPKFCYQTNGVELETMMKNDNITLLYYGLKELEHYSIMFNIQIPNILQVVDTSSIIFDALYPIGLLAPSYNPQQRSWYQNHMAQINNTKNEFFFFTNVFQSLYGSQEYSFSITQSLFNKKKEFFAILKTVLFITDPNLHNIQFNVLLINQEGQVMENGMENRTNRTGILYVYNETITGFNVTDWKEIELKSNQNGLIEEQNSMLILYNKVYKSFVNLKCKKFQKENFTLILFTNLTSQYILKQQILDRYNEFLLQYGYAAVVICCLAITLFCLSLIFINVICNPIVKLRQKISQHVLEIGNNTDKMIFKMTTKKKRKQGLVFKLNEMFMNISDVLKLNQNKKSEQCRLIEKMQYNKKCKKEQCQLNQQIQSLSDSQSNYIELNEFNKEILKLLMNGTNNNSQL